MDVDWSVWEFLSQSRDQQFRGSGSEESSHILDCQRMRTHINQLTTKVHVIFEVVLALRRISNITSVTHGTLNETTSLSSSVDTELQVVEVIQRIEDTEDINSRVLSLIAKFVNDVVGVVGVSNSVSTAQQHLERNIRGFLPERLQTFPWAFMQKSHRNIKCSSTPHFHRKGVRHYFVGSFCASFKFLGSHTSCQQRLMGITPSGVHNHESLVVTDGLRHAFGTFIEQNTSQTVLLHRRWGDDRLINVARDTKC
mmetsp:Transcript_3062/g.6783  ORF Transcript_3062/g.6783 Transcript_3062/m.6783 type:complete len:254 (-) Transcript_3062:558-1319(-)